LERFLIDDVDENDLHTQGELPMMEKRWILPFLSVDDLMERFFS
jgi:hypothetical protein